jgi:uncharacterized protein YndB with AHSA1/START domain
MSPQMTIPAIIHNRRYSMANICLSIGTRASASTLLNALTTVDGLKAWWTSGTSGNPAQGGTIEFRFGGNGGFDMRVVKSDDTQVQWECVSGPEDWLGTRLEFEIQKSDTQNKLMFRHAGWRSENPHFHHCSTKWATFLLSLRDLVESGQGRPFPNDVKIEVV